ncbi:MAG: nucleotidyltransferase domain-containing protein [Deltaproteobacteria bacterium]|nr:nucleotidyltransferase domain-containing protein [Deltaproteobacteria bacterium]
MLFGSRSRGGHWEGGDHDVLILT